MVGVLYKLNGMLSGGVGVTTRLRGEVLGVEESDEGFPDSRLVASTPSSSYSLISPPSPLSLGSMDKLRFFVGPPLTGPSLPEKETRESQKH